MSIALNQILNSQWAMTEEALRLMLSVVERHSDIEVLERIRGQRFKATEKATIRSGVGVIPVRGPLFKRANLMTEHCGATSYESVLRDFHEMLASVQVQSIILDIDSPGGEANGCSELADHIFEARGQKPIAAYIGGIGASAAYWIASACDRVFSSDSAIVGSIGVQSALRSEKNEGEIRFVSSQSPNKNRDPGTEEGAREVQSVIDGLAEVFISKVARNRGVGRETVLENFGQGSVFVGAEAQRRGLIDEITTLETVIANYGAQGMTTESITAEYIAANHPAIAEHFINIGASRTLARFEAEQKRVAGIRSLAEGLVSEDFVDALIERNLSCQEAAVEILQAIKRNPPKPKADPKKEFDAHFQGLDVPPIPSADSTSELAAQQDAAIILARKMGITGGMT
ncbi:MAG TPA: S49 family peptidase [Oligoflexus sp.]|uniref:S49 family peptidase n=1 Tax=Oligoflexus sp. TaxID=1971216 RepID=UPI002D8023F7|nr:S49 family peptidase [Oligoflexus sp.]HET9239467.1 S49 family peptidase [Oligoflexus sp.]